MQRAGLLSQSFSTPSNTACACACARGLSIRDVSIPAQQECALLLLVLLAPSLLAILHTGFVRATTACTTRYRARHDTGHDTIPGTTRYRARHDTGHDTIPIPGTTWHLGSHAAESVTQHTSGYHVTLVRAIAGTCRQSSSENTREEGRGLDMLITLLFYMLALGIRGWTASLSLFVCLGPASGLHV
jgi:hypothetical protein